MRVLPTRWRWKPAGRDIKRNYVTVTHPKYSINWATRHHVTVSHCTAYFSGSSIKVTECFRFGHVTARARPLAWNAAGRRTPLPRSTGRTFWSSPWRKAPSLGLLTIQTYLTSPPVPRDRSESSSTILAMWRCPEHARHSTSPQGRLRHINDGANAPWKNGGKVFAGT